jgi:hypothetical protein
VPWFQAVLPLDRYKDLIQQRLDGTIDLPNFMFLTLVAAGNSGQQVVIATTNPDRWV